MKIKLLIVFVGMSLNSFAQDPVLFDTPWSLQDLIINDESNPPPNNDEVMVFPSLSGG